MRSKIELDGMGSRRKRRSAAADELASIGRASSTRSMLDLQRTAGNAAVTQLITLQRDGGHAVEAPSATELDAQAHAIITAARAATPGIGDRAVNAVRAILDTYYADKRAMVSGIHYDASEPGLLTTSQGHGASSTGSIAVGQYFITNTTEAFFARRVLQVGHELEHIQQHREGKGGEGHRHEREFLAFYHEATNPALPHTGKVSHATRVDLMDEAIRHYNAMPDDQKRQYADKHAELLAKRSEEQQKSRRGHTDPPTEAAH